jgi:hypothetical protein
MEKNAKRPMSETVEKIMDQVKLPIHRARAYYRTFVRNNSAPGVLPVRAQKAEAPTKTVKRAKGKTTPAQRQRKPAPAAEAQA